MAEANTILANPLCVFKAVNIWTARKWLRDRRFHCPQLTSKSEGRMLSGYARHVGRHQYAPRPIDPHCTLRGRVRGQLDPGSHWRRSNACASSWIGH